MFWLYLCKTRMYRGMCSRLFTGVQTFSIALLVAVSYAFLQLLLGVPEHQCDVMQLFLRVFFHKVAMKTLAPVFLSHVQRLTRNANLPIGVCNARGATR